jgi:hypothetical protein
MQSAVPNNSFLTAATFLTTQNENLHVLNFCAPYNKITTGTSRLNFLPSARFIFKSTKRAAIQFDTQDQLRPVWNLTNTRMKLGFLLIS